MKRKLQTTLWHNAFYKGIVMLFFTVLSSNAYSAAMSGTYSICASSCSYSSIGAAVSDLTSYGVSGAVKFNIYGGSYKESITVGAITGASATNTITFNGNGSNASSTGSNGTGVTRVYSSSAIVFFLNSCKYVTLQNMIIDQTGTSSYTLETYFTQYCNISNCLIRYPTTGSGFNVYDNSSLKTVWTNNTIIGGTYNIYSTTGSFSTSYGFNTMTGNKLTKANSYNYYSFYSYQSTFDGNYFDSLLTVSYSVVEYYGNGNTWKNNIVGGSNVSYGMYLQNPNSNTNSYAYTAYNNMVGTLGLNNTCTYGIDCIIGSTSSCNVHLLFNTVNMKGGAACMYFSSSTSGSGWEIVNNNFTNSSTTPAVIFVGASTEKIDGNNFYNTGGSLLTYNAVNYSDIASYKSAASAYGLGANDKNAAVTYKSSTDLHVDQSKSAPFGKNVGSTTDIDGDARCTIFPTCGADESTYAKSKPSTSITGSSTVYANSPSTFFNSAKAGEPKLYTWYLDTILASAKLSDSIHLVTTALTKGSHTIKLVTQTCTGPETAKFAVSVIAPTKAPVSDFLGSATYIKAGDFVSYTDLSTNGPSKWAWSVSPATTVNAAGVTVPTISYLYGTSSSSYNPVMRFNFPGKYQICLVASNAAGTGTTQCKTDYIEVIASVSMGTTNTVYTPKGYLYDDGGPIGNYSNKNGTSSILLSPCADSVYMVLDYFNTWCGYDFLRIYDGTSNKGTLLNKSCSTKFTTAVGYTGGPVSTFCNGTLPGCIPNTVNNYKTGGTIDTFLAKSGNMFIEFETHFASFAQGFEAYYWSVPGKFKKPAAKFSCADSICINKPLSFTNLSTGANNNYLWDLDGDPSLYEYVGTNNPSFTYNKAGTYKVYLIANNCGGSDTFIKTIKVVNPPKAVTAFTADNYNPTTNDVVYLSSSAIKECVDGYSWTIVKKYAYKTGTTPTVIYLNSTTSSSANPVITLPDTGCWDVTLKATNVSGSVSKFSSCFFLVKQAYCSPDVATLYGDVGISKVTFNTISNSSSQGTQAYQNFIPTVSTTVEIGGIYKLTVERSSNKNTMNRSVYIDWNNDGDFDDNLENYDNENAATTLSWTTSIKVPTLAVEGASVMRIATNLGAYSNKPCGTNEYGEYEDYRIYIIKDRTKPWITMIGAKDTLKATDTVYVERGKSYTDKGAVAYDNISLGLTAKIKVTQSPAFNKMKPGIYKIIYNVTDDAGNVADPKTRVVIVGADKTPPYLIVTAPDTTIIQVFHTYKTPAVAFAIDSVDGDVTKNVKITKVVDTSKIGLYTITYSVTDSASNTAKVYRYVKVIDSIHPFIKLKWKDTIYVEAGTAYIDSGVSAKDNYNTEAYLQSHMTKTSTVDIYKTGIFSVTYYTKDEYGNKSNTLKRIVIVRDDIAPVISIKGKSNVTIEVYDTYTDSGASVKDNFYNVTNYKLGGTFFANFPTGKTTKIGTYTISYTAIDGSGNKDSAFRYIHVVDTLRPVIALKGKNTASICRWQSYTDEGYDLTDNYWDKTGILITREGSFATFNTQLANVYNFKYKAIDGSGNFSYSESRYVLVEEAGTANCNSGITNPQDIARQISVFPNPSTGKFAIKLDMPGKVNARIWVTNAMGQEIAVVNNNSLSNDNTYEINLGNNASGLYLLNVIINNVLVTKQLVINR